MSSDLDRVTLDNCDQEQIHIPGSIQPHGAMIVCDPVTFAIRFTSANLAIVTGHTAGAFPGTSVESVLGRKALHDLRNAAAKAGPSGGAGIVMGLRLPGTETRFDAMIHHMAGNCIIEMEPSEGEAAQDALNVTRMLIARISAETTPSRLTTMGARCVQAMLGYDRVMIYRFLHNGAGRVVSEARTPNLGSFMGQHFPASDIPAQARRLYLENPIRMISDAEYQPIPLVPALMPGQAPVDMSHAQLRSVSPIQCEYLRNMGVGASLSISLIVGGELWGLIACHHYSPRIVPLAQRIGAELFGHYFALQIASVEHRSAIEASARVREELDALVAQVSASDPLILSLPAHLPLLAQVMNCDGAALVMDGATFVSGSAPTQQQCESLVFALARPETTPRDLWHTQNIREVVADATTPLAGVMAIPLSQRHNDHLLLFRNEEAHEVAWAGEPVKTLDKADRLSPRGSFETWREEVRGKSVPWSETDITVAKAVRAWLRDLILRRNEASAEEFAQDEQRRRILNSELNHRVKNVIALVKSIALQTGQSAGTVEDYIAALEGRLQALAIAHDQSLGHRVGSLAELVETEIGFHRAGSPAGRLTVKGPVLQLDARAFAVLAMVLHEIATNAAKHGALSVPEGRLTVIWVRDAAGDLQIRWRETDGPPVSAPRRTGFGTRLIHSSIEYDLKGKVELVYDPAGFRADITIPGRHVQFGVESLAEASPEPQERGSLLGLAVLVVEDQGLIAMDVEQTLHGLGAGDVRLASDSAAALTLLKEFTPDLAILDFSLGDETSELAATELIARGIPIIFMTGYSDQIMLPTALRHIPLIRKPVSPAALEMQVAGAMR